MGYLSLDNQNCMLLQLCVARLLTVHQHTPAGSILSDMLIYCSVFGKFFVGARYWKSLLTVP